MSVPSDATSPEHGRTVRQRALDAYKALAESIQDDGQPIFRKVYWGDLEDLGNEALPAMGIDFGTEEMIGNTFPCSTYDLPVFLHFRFRTERGLAEHDIYQYYLGLIQLAMLGDHNLDGLTLNVREDSNAHTIIGIEDVYPGGTLSVVITYKTRTHNPYKQPHEPA